MKCKALADEDSCYNDDDTSVYFEVQWPFKMLPEDKKKRSFNFVDSAQSAGNLIAYFQFVFE